ncbi:MAG: OmpA family protein [Deltaproteobacteria bacterium]|nr:OmpA family protein [Deltaproteobacteria bacterium]
MRLVFKVGLAVLAAFLLIQAADHTPAQAKVKDHPIIKPLPSVIKKSGEYKRFDAFTFRVKKGEGYEEKKVKGKFWHFTYETREDVSGLEILENYRSAALEKGGKILYEDESQLVFTLPTPQGNTLWVQVDRNGWDAYYYLNIIEEKGFKKTLTFGAAAMKAALEEKGSVAVYGIHFDFDKATLKPGAEKVLVEIVKLLKDSPDLKVEIQGHTDNVGGKDYNLKLSQARADTVKQFLVLYGIEPERLTTKGYGMEKPVASNETEEGRAKNRRVELKKL